MGGVIALGLLEGLGHILGAKTGGYSIVSMCLFYFTFYKTDGKWKFKMASYDGLTGETKIVPNYKKKERPNPYPFYIYGPVFVTAWIIVCAFMFFTYKNNDGIESDIAYFFLTMGIIALLGLIYNIVPAKLDSMTDGYRLSQIKKDVESFNDLLDAENGGGSTIEKADDTKERKENKPTKLVAELMLNNVYDLLAEKNYEKAFEMLDEILSHEKEITQKVFLEAKSQYLYAYIVSKSIDEAREYYEKEISFQFRRELSNDYSLPVIRTYILSAGLLDNSQSEVMLSLKKVIKAYKNIPAKRKHAELVLFNDALDLIIQAHPKWEEIPNYKLYE